MKLNISSCNSPLFCTSFFCCVIFSYLFVIAAALVVFHVIYSDKELVSCDPGFGEFYQTKNSCSSNNVYLNVDLNSSVQTEVTQCNIGEISTERCAKPKTFVLYDLLSIDRITSRFGYLSQCALEDFWPVNQ